MERIFSEHMTELYSLAYILSGDRERSIQAYTGAVNSDSPAPALQKFMLSWARRLVIVAALGTIRRQLRESMLKMRACSGVDFAGLRLAHPDLSELTRDEIENVLLGMDTFERCVVVLAILERLPVKDVAELLGTDEALVKTALARGVTDMTLRMSGLDSADAGWPSVFGQKTLVAFG
jgi:DNA-directed RNA polymerase specialized sigma24 family protein